MELVMKVVTFITQNYQMVITSIVGILTGIIAICMLIPGDQPEKFLKGAVDFLAKFSKKDS